MVLLDIFPAFCKLAFSLKVLTSQRFHCQSVCYKVECLGQDYYWVMLMSRPAAQELSEAAQLAEVGGGAAAAGAGCRRHLRPPRGPRPRPRTSQQETQI